MRGGLREGLHWKWPEMKGLQQDYSDYSKNTVHVGTCAAAVYNQRFSRY